MAWFKIDDGFYDHPKVVDLSLEAVGLWALTGAYCARHLTDGILTARSAARLGGTPELIGELVEAGLWHPIEDNGRPSYQFNDWDEYQPSREEKLAEREAGKARAAESRKRRKAAEEARRAAASSEAESNVRSDDSRTPPARSPERSPEPPANVREDVQVNARGTSAGRSAPPTRPDPTRPDPSEKPSAPTARERGDALFEQVWPLWPKKDDRKDALQKFHIALRKFKGREGELVKAITDHAEAYRLYRDLQFTPALAVWLNKERWDNPLVVADGSTPAGEGAAKKDPNAWMQPPKRIDRRHLGDDVA